MARGRFITFEGGEGVGKSTQIRTLATVLGRAGHSVVATREPGGSAGAEAVRHVLLSGAAESFGPRMEALLFAAARSDHVEQVIRPAVEAGKFVLCDRFMDSTRVYQGTTGALDPAFVDTLERVTVNAMVPDLTVILDLDPEEGLRRAAARRGADIADRFEKEDIDIHRQRRQAFLEIAASQPHRCAVVDAGGDAESVARAVAATVEERLGIEIRAQTEKDGS